MLGARAREGIGTGCLRPVRFHATLPPGCCTRLDTAQTIAPMAAAETPLSA